uniref:Uncharacterized protein n=1 Tax=Leptocylindrus danicus TaxID=163516 RepID=A0A7S2KAW7_9STRA|mmetsp:Transcript_20710/g.30833  ORF Transcript_20710/g.30833 Transcript_20710/m.30833 type:complete len:331 (+) Transcript_20710:121-1113(+)
MFQSKSRGVKIQSRSAHYFAKLTIIKSNTMKFSIAALTLLTNTAKARLFFRHDNTNEKQEVDVQRNTQTTACYDGKNIRFTVADGDCSEDEFLEGLQAALDSKNNCDNDASTELDLLTDGGTEAALANITALCETFLDSIDQVDIYESLTGDLKNERALEEYFDGGTTINEERQYTDDEGTETWVAADDYSKVNTFYNNYAQDSVVNYPSDMKNFAECEIRAAYCCWAADRQANDNNGNCEEPYDDACVDADPGDNTDVCYVDMANAPTSARVAGGYAIFNDDVEGDIHCHGFAWGNDETSASAVYKGNNLFYVSLYDHFYQRGYVRNVP